MNFPVVPWFDLAAMQARRAAELAWFVYGCAQREQHLNAHAWFGWWTRGAAALPYAAPPLSPLAGAPLARAEAAGAAT